MEKHFLLSICIPTYNRNKLLQETLDSITVQLTADVRDQVEVCISDNASTDDTITMLDTLIAANPQLNIRYDVNEKNMGPDHNFILSMKMGTADYIWMVGSDDTLVPGSIARILEVLTSNKDFGLLLFNRIDCTYDMVPKYKRYWLHESIESETFDFSDKYQEGFYYGNANDTGALFSYISAFVAKKEMLTLFEFDQSYIGTSYSFLFYVYSYLKSGIKVLYLKEHFVNCRLDNSSFTINVPYRLNIDFKGFIKINDDYFKNDINSHAFLYVLKKTHAFTKIFTLYLSTTSHEWKNKFVPMLKKCGWLDRELQGFEMIGNPLVKTLFKVKNNVGSMKKKLQGK